MADSVHAEIDLHALRHNLQVARRHAPHSRVVAVVKAMAYGHGALPVARALQAHADALAVARVGEGLRLREAGIGGRLLVLEGAFNPEELAQAAAQRLDLAVHQPYQLEQLRAHAGPAVDCWLKIDTGMHRLGFEPGQIGALHAQLIGLDAVRSVRLMTHLANADDLDDDYTRTQLGQLRLASDGLGAELSVANSAAVLGWPESHADWVRPGLMLYGGSPLQGRSAADLGLRPVMSLRAPLIAIRPVAKGQPVGYSGIWRAPGDGMLGVVAIGYGDGYPRHIGANAKVLLNGQQLPVVGRVSMDMISVDLRGVEAEIGDLVTLWGVGLPVDQVASWANTIAYTLFCGVTERVERRYLGQS